MKPRVPTAIKDLEQQILATLAPTTTGDHSAGGRFYVEMPAADLERLLTVAYVAEVRRRGFRENLDDSTLSHIKAVTAWLIDPRGKVGLMLQGLFGNGKSTMLRAVVAVIERLYHAVLRSERIEVRQVDARDVVRLGADKDRRADFMNIVTAPLLAIDDLGDEPAEVMSFGMVYTPMRDLLLERYKRNLLTIVSTNLATTSDKVTTIARHYGPRVADRLDEMMHRVVFVNPSYRSHLQAL